jgi:hypothetical protein
MKKLLTYGAGLIALYLGLEYATGSGTLLNDGSQGIVSVVKSFQGR